MKKTIYISGKITGTDDYEAKFAEAEKKLEEQGYLVINPVEYGKLLQDIFSPKVPKWRDYMKSDLQALMTTDRIYMLKDYKESKGARLEHFLAKILKYKIIYE